MDAHTLSGAEQRELREYVVMSFSGMLDSLLTENEIVKLPQYPQLTVFEWRDSAARIMKLEKRNSTFALEAWICEGELPARHILKKQDSNSSKFGISRYIEKRGGISLVYECVGGIESTCIYLSTLQMGKHVLKIHIDGSNKGRIEFGDGSMPLMLDDLLTRGFGDLIDIQALAQQDADKVAEITRPLRELLFSGDVESTP